MLLIAVLLSVGVPCGAERPDFSGNWVLDVQRTTLQVAALAGLESASVRIEHRGSRFRLWRRFVLAGEEHTVAFELTADGKEVASEVGDQRRLSRLTWDADTLVFTTRLPSRSGESVNTVRYALLEDGRVLQARETFRGPQLSYDNVWVFVRAVE